MRIVPSPPFPTDPLAHQLEGRLNSPASGLLCTSSESLVSLVEGEVEDCWREGGDAAGQRTRSPTEGTEVDARGEVTDCLNSQLDERQREEEEEEESNDMNGKEEEDADSEEERTVRQEAETWCGCRAYGEGLQRGTVHDANAFVIDTSEAEWGEVSGRRGKAQII